MKTIKFSGIALGLVLIVLLLTASIITRDGERVVVAGEGTVILDAGTFEAYPLPDYAAKFANDQYKSYLVEVEQGVKVHVLEVGSGANRSLISMVTFIVLMALVSTLYQAGRFQSGSGHFRKLLFVELRNSVMASSSVVIRH